MRITVRFFAVLRERAGIDQITLDVKPGSCVASAVEIIGEQLPALRPLLPRVAFAVNRDYVKSDHLLEDGDELALIPPVSGG